MQTEKNNYHVAFTNKGSLPSPSPFAACLHKLKDLLVLDRGGGTI